jgi:hypothetical protein
VVFDAGAIGLFVEVEGGLEGLVGLVVVGVGDGLSVEAIGFGGSLGEEEKGLDSHGACFCGVGGQMRSFGISMPRVRGGYAMFLALPDSCYSGPHLVS